MNTLEFCEKYLGNYTINSDDTIDVNGNVSLSYALSDITKLPVKFGKVSGYFWCEGNNLTTLEGCPNYVGGSFDCRGNNLSTLEGCPKYVGGGFYSDILTHHIDGGFYSDILTHHILGNVQGDIYCDRHRIVI